MSNPPIHHQHWGPATGDLIETTPEEHVQRHAEYLRAQCQEAGIDPEVATVLVERIVRRRSCGAIRKAHNFQRGRVEHLLRVWMPVLQGQPGFWDAAKEFERQIVACAANKDDHDSRPADMRGVEPDKSSQKFQGQAMIPRGDLRLRQDGESAARLSIYANA